MDPYNPLSYLNLTHHLKELIENKRVTNVSLPVNSSNTNVLPEIPSAPELVTNNLNFYLIALLCVLVIIMVIWGVIKCRRYIPPFPYLRIAQDALFAGHGMYFNKF